MTVIHDLPATNDDAFTLIERSLSPHKAKAFRDLGIDLVQGRREGVRVWDLEGRDYINCRSSGGVFNFGHHPAFAVEALSAALREHDMGDWLLPSARRAQGAEALARLLPERVAATRSSPPRARRPSRSRASWLGRSPGARAWCAPSTATTATWASRWPWTTRRCPSATGR